MSSKNSANSDTATAFSTVDIYNRTGRKLVTPAELDNPDSGVVSLLTPEELAAISKAVDWLKTAIMMPVNKAGKTEAVCPFAKPAVDQRLIYMSVGPLKNPADPTEIVNEIRICADIYDQLPGKRAKDALLRSLMVILPNTPDGLLNECAPPKRRSIKTDLMQRGIMVGEFFPSEYMKATWDQNFRIPPSPVPFYIIRTFIENDWRFINHVPAWRVAFKKYFPKPPRERLSAKTKIKRFVEELVLGH